MRIVTYQTRLDSSNVDKIFEGYDVFPGIEGLKPLGHEGDIVLAILDETPRVARRLRRVGCRCCRMGRQRGRPRYTWAELLRRCTWSRSFDVRTAEREGVCSLRCTTRSRSGECCSQ